MSSIPEHLLAGGIVLGAGYTSNLYNPEYGIDELYTWTHVYKRTHSVFLYVLLFLAAFLMLVDASVVYGALAGCVLHILMDVPTHRDTWILWPIQPMKLDTDWWNSWPFNKGWWRHTTLALVPWVPGWVIYWLM